MKAKLQIMVGAALWGVTLATTVAVPGASALALPGLLTGALACVLPVIVSIATALAAAMAVPDVVDSQGLAIGVVLALVSGGALLGGTLIGWGIRAVLKEQA